MTRAAVMYDYFAPLTIEEVTVKEPNADEVVVKIAASGICRTDLSVIECHLPYPPPVVLGHEAAGVVERVGANVKHVKVGDHVVLAATTQCGHCIYCQNGKPHLCITGFNAAAEGTDWGFEKDGVNIARFCGIGAFSERALVRGTQCIRIPDDVPLHRACLLGCAVVTGVGSVINAAKVAPGDLVAVFGCGGIGLNVIQGAVLSSAGKIIAIDTDRRKLEAARQFGATHTIHPDDVEDVVEAIRRLSDGQGVDFAFEAIGVTTVMNTAFMALRRGGKAVIVGVAGFGADVTLPACLFSLEERSVLGTLFGSTNMWRDVPRLIELYQRERLKLDELVSLEVPLDGINDAIEKVKSGEVLRAVIRMDL